MAYTSLSFSPNEILTSGKMNQVAANDAALRDGSGIVDDAILTRHLLNSNVTSPKLAEAFFRGRKKANTTNSDITGYKVQHGWGFIVGDGSSSLSKSVTFPTAFSSAPIVLISFIAAASVSAGTPTSPANFTTGWSSYRGCGTDDIDTSGFIARLEATAAHSSSFNFGFAWIAIGAA